MAPLPRARAFGRCTLGGLLALVCILLGAGPAAAHADLESSDPPAGAHLDRLPPEVRLTFAEPVLVHGASVMLIGATASAPLSRLALDADGTTLSAAVPPDVGLTGAISVVWTVVSRDGHPVSGDIGIAVGHGAVLPTPIDPGVADDSRLIDGLVTADRTLGYLGLAVLCGGVVFLVSLWPEGADLVRSRRLLWAAWAVSLIATLAGIALQAAIVRGSILSEALDGDALGSVLTSPFGRAWGARALLLLLAVPLLTALGRWGRGTVRSPWFVVSAAAVAVGMLRPRGLVAHAAEGDLGAVGAAADLIHLAGVVSWVGGLVFLVAVVLPRRRPMELQRVVPAFSRLATLSIAGIVVGGTVMAWDLAGTLGSLDSTEWGRLLLLKVGMFVAVLVAAQLSKRWVYDRLAVAVALRGHLVLVRPFLWSAAAEALLAASILGVAGALVTTSPGR